MSFDWRAVKQEARNIVHDTMAVPALYLTEPNGSALPVTVRVHTRFAAVGALQSGWAERHEEVPKAVFLQAQVEPVRNAFFVLEDGSTYVIDTVQPPDPPTITAEIYRASDTEMPSLGLTADTAWGGLTYPSA